MKQFLFTITVLQGFAIILGIVLIIDDQIVLALGEVLVCVSLSTGVCIAEMRFQHRKHYRKPAKIEGGIEL